MKSGARHCRTWAASGLLAFVLAAWAVTGVAETPPSAADIAREKNEGRRVEDDFNARVAASAGVPPARIEKLLPDDRRITVRSERFIEAIEARIRPLSEEEKGEIRRADRQRRDALGNLRRPSR